MSNCFEKFFLGERAKGRWPLWSADLAASDKYRLSASTKIYSSNPLNGGIGGELEGRAGGAVTDNSPGPPLNIKEEYQHWGIGILGVFAEKIHLQAGSDIQPGGGEKFQGRQEADDGSG